MNNDSGKLKKFQVLCPRDMESCHLAAARCMKLWSLNAKLFFKKPQQLIPYLFSNKPISAISWDPKLLKKKFNLIHTNCKRIIFGYKPRPILSLDVYHRPWNFRKNTNWHGMKNYCNFQPITLLILRKTRATAWNTKVWVMWYMYFLMAVRELFTAGSHNTNNLCCAKRSR